MANMNEPGLRIDLYDCESGEAKLYGFHMNGTQHAAFSSPFGAWAWFRGLGRDQRYFYLTNASGERVTMAMNGAGHAYSIIEKLNKAGS